MTGWSVVDVGSVPRKIPRKIRKINNASFVWHNFVRTVIAFFLPLFSDLHLKTEKEYNIGISRETGKRIRLYREGDE